MGGSTLLLLFQFGYVAPVVVSAATYASIRIQPTTQVSSLNLQPATQASIKIAPPA